MEELFKIGLDNSIIMEMVKINENISDMSDDEISKYILFLRQIGCNDSHIRNIVQVNPYYFNRSFDDLISLINKLREIGLTHINLLIDSNPFLLNNDSYEIDEFI